MADSKISKIGLFT